MKALRASLPLVVIAVATLLVVPVAARATEDPLIPIAGVQGPTGLAPVIDSIRQAPDPSAAVEAYAKGRTLDPDNLLLEETYLRRMVDFGLPQMADAQAQELVKRDPSNGLAWAVVAFVSAARGDTSAALAAIVPAVQHLPGDPFVQRTAGQLLAWYDTTADKGEAADSLKEALEKMRAKLADRPAFADAYRAARDFYQDEGETAEKSPTAAEPAPAVEYEGPPSASPIYNSYSYNTYEMPGEPYVYAPYPDLSRTYPAYSSGYFGGTWWPRPSSVIIVRRHHDHFLCRHRPERGGFAWFGAQRHGPSFFRQHDRGGLVGPRHDRNDWVLGRGRAPAVVRRGSEQAHRPSREALRPTWPSLRRDSAPALAAPPRRTLSQGANRPAPAPRVAPSRGGSRPAVAPHAAPSRPFNRPAATPQPARRPAFSRPAGSSRAALPSALRRPAMLPRPASLSGFSRPPATPGAAPSHRGSRR